MSETTIIARMRCDGVLVQIKPDGTEGVMQVELMAAMAPQEVEAAAWLDPELLVPPAT